MTQSAFIGGALAAGFVLFLANKNRLTTYANVLWGPTAAGLPSFLGIPLVNVGGTPANTNEPTGGGGSGGSLITLPAALSPFNLFGGSAEAAANSNWLDTTLPAELPAVAAVG